MIAMVLASGVGGVVNAAAPSTAFAAAEKDKDYYDFVDEMNLTPKQRTFYLRVLRGSVFGILVALVGFGLFYVMSYTGMAGDIGPRFFRSRGDTILLRFIGCIFLSAVIFGAVGAAGVEFGFINYLIGQKPATPDDEIF